VRRVRRLGPQKCGIECHHRHFLPFSPRNLGSELLNFRSDLIQPSWPCLFQSSALTHPRVPSPPYKLEPRSRYNRPRFYLNPAGRSRSQKAPRPVGVPSLRLEKSAFRRWIFRSHGVSHSSVRPRWLHSCGLALLSVFYLPFCKFLAQLTWS
jgi:hypothetical protein